MASVNEVRIMGNLGQDPDLRFTQAGVAVCTLSVATSKKWTDDKGEHEQTEWHRIVCWGKTAESVAAAKRKGDQVYIAGYLQTRKYTDDKGIDRYSTEVVAGQWQWGGVLFTGKAPSNRPAHPADTGDAPHQGAPNGRSAGMRDTIDGAPPPNDDDIPF